MRIAIVSDIHDNLTAFDAVLRDLREMAPDLVLHGGDLAGGGSRPAEIVDHIRDLKWPGVIGNSDEGIARPETLEAFVAQSTAPPSVWAMVREMNAFTQAALGSERIAWLGALPRVLIHAPVALVHASPESPWRSPGANAPDAELASVYAPLGQPVAVYGHIHQPFVRNLGTLTVVNTGSVSQPFDGDPRASYLLMEDGALSIRRVEYDVEQEIAVVKSRGVPHSEWIARMLRSARP